MLETAPTAALTSATNVWKVYYKELFEGAQAGSIPQDWCKGYEDGRTDNLQTVSQVEDTPAEEAGSKVERSAFEAGGNIYCRVTRSGIYVFGSHREESCQFCYEVQTYDQCYQSDDE